MFILLSVLIAAIGAFTYALASNAKVAEMGRIMFFCGLLAFVLNAERIISLLPR